MSDPNVKPAVTTAVGFAADRANRRAAAERNVSARHWLVSEAGLPDDEREREARLLFAHWQASKVIRPAADDAYNEAAGAAIDGAPPPVPDDSGLPDGWRSKPRRALVLVPALMLVLLPVGILSVLVRAAFFLASGLLLRREPAGRWVIDRDQKRRRWPVLNGRLSLSGSLSADYQSHPRPRIRHGSAAPGDGGDEPMAADPDGAERLVLAAERACSGQILMTAG